MAGCRKCCSIPHGLMSMIAAVLATFGWILGSAGVYSCRYVLADVGGPNSGLRGWGLYSFEGYTTNNPYYQYVCYTTNTSTMGYDAAWSTARAFGIMSNIIGVICTIMIWVAMCYAYPPKAWKILGVFEMIAAICVIVTMSFFGSSVCYTVCESTVDGYESCKGGCTFSVGAGLVVGSFILYAMAGCVCFKMPPYKEEDEGEFAQPAAAAAAPAAAPGTVTTTETVQPDGTKVIEKVTVNADGSKTVERTTERLDDNA